MKREFQVFELIEWFDHYTQKHLTGLKFLHMDYEESVCLQWLIENKEGNKEYTILKIYR